MVLLIYVNSAIKGAHVRSNFCYKLDLFVPKRPNFLHACATCSEIPSHISTMVAFRMSKKDTLISSRHLLTSDKNNRYSRTVEFELYIIMLSSSTACARIQCTNGIDCRSELPKKIF